MPSPAQDEDGVVVWVLELKRACPPVLQGGRLSEPQGQRPLLVERVKVVHLEADANPAPVSIHRRVKVDPHAVPLQPDEPGLAVLRRVEEHPEPELRDVKVQRHGQIRGGQVGHRNVHGQGLYPPLSPLNPRRVELVIPPASTQRGSGEAGSFRGTPKSRLSCGRNGRTRVKQGIRLGRAKLPSSMLKVPQTHYARSGDVSIAYQVYGSGAVDLVQFPGFISHVEDMWQNPAFERYAEQLGSFSRLIRFDKRGTGLSDRHHGIASMEERMDDVRAVMDAAGSDRAFLMGVSEGGPLSALFAATYPERVLGLILYGTTACNVRKPDYPWGPDATEVEAFAEKLVGEWGSKESSRHHLDTWLAPSCAGDERVCEWFDRLTRSAASPTAAGTLWRMNRLIDVRPALAAVQCRTLVLRRQGDQGLTDAEARYMAGLIPGARFVELPGVDHMEWAGEADALVSEIELFVTGRKTDRVRDRVLATVLFTDIVDSTKLAAICGDSRWRELRMEHDNLARTIVEEHRGRWIKSMGDGILATFDGPARGIRCAQALGLALKSKGLQIRAGLHTGEIDLVGDDVSGIAVNLAARIMALAPDGEVAVSRTVKDLVAGSNLTFVDFGTHALKGFEGDWQVYRVG